MLGISSIPHFPLPTPPPTKSLTSGLRTLVALGALVPRTREHRAAGEVKLYRDETLTDLGRALAILPLSPRLGKILLLGVQHYESLQAKEGGKQGSGGDDTEPHAKRQKTPQQLSPRETLDLIVAVVAALSINDPRVRPSLGPKAEAGKSNDAEGAEEAQDDEEEELGLIKAPKTKELSPQEIEG